MGPNGKCINCGANDWLASDRVSFIPKVGAKGSDAAEGLHVSVWMCKKCWYMMFFGTTD